MPSQGRWNGLVVAELIHVQAVGWDRDRLLRMVGVSLDILRGCFLPAVLNEIFPGISQLSVDLVFQDLAGSPEHALDTCRIPVPRKNGEL